MESPGILVKAVASPMDHLPAPYSPAHPPVEVLYLGTEEYDGGPFLTYPSRKGWPFAEIEHPWPPRSRRSQNEVDSFLQTWLWFGLLTDFFGRRVHIEDFVAETDHGLRLLTTRNLKGLLNNWIVREKAFSQNVKRRRKVHFETLLWRVYNLLAIWGQFRRDPFSSPWMTTSLSILGETLDRALIEAFLDVKENGNNQRESQRRENNWPIAPLNPISKRMVQDGWCISAIRRLSGPVNQGGRYYASRMKRPKPEISHERCSMNVCLSQNVALDEYKPKHTDDLCNCQYLDVGRDKIITILESGRIPVVSFTENGKLQVTDSEQAAVKYVAISHVWSDGLGNPDGNALPYCQLQRLADLTAKLYGSANEAVYFWLDTLCCPVSPKRARNLAIALMRKTYLQADKVLVLDSFLVNKQIQETSEAEASMMIFNSLWNRRLWTLEECVLAGSRLLFQFNGGALNPKDVLINILADHVMRTSIISSMPILDGPAAECSAIGRPTIIARDLLFLTDPEIPVRDKILTIQRALEDRQTSDIGDEAVCLGHMLNLDVKAILDTSKNKRMEAFWSMIDDIPSDIVFWRRGRHETKGLRWAPSTLLGGLGFLGGTGKACNYSTVGKGLGLYAVFPGWTLGCKPDVSIQILFRFVDNFGNAFVVTCMPDDFDGTAATLGPKIFNPWTIVDDYGGSQAELAIITKSDFRKSSFIEEFDAALVIVSEVKGNVRYCRKVRHATVKKVDTDSIGDKAAATLAQMRRSFAGRPLPETWVAGDMEGDVNYTDFMSGKALDTTTFWCID